MSSLNFNRVEKLQHRNDVSQESFDANGSVLEEEMIGTANKRQYKEQAYKALYPEDCSLENLEPTERFEKILKIREAAQQEFQDINDFYKKRISLEKAMELVEKCQTGDPENPARLFANQLYQAIKDRFVNDKYILKFFSAAGGTHLDISHGVDCYFKLYDKETGKELTRATIDLTKRPNKDSTSADVVINISQTDKEKFDNSKNNRNFDPKFTQEFIAKEAEKITDAMIENFKKRNQ